MLFNPIFHGFKHILCHQKKSKNLATFTALFTHQNEYTCKLTSSGTYTWTTNVKFLYDICPFVTEIKLQFISASTS